MLMRLCQSDEGHKLDIKNLGHLALFLCAVKITEIGRLLDSLCLSPGCDLPRYEFFKTFPPSRYLQHSKSSNLC